MSTGFNGSSGTSGNDGLRHCFPVLVNLDARVKERRLAQLGLGFRHLVSFQYSQTNVI